VKIDFCDADVLDVFDEWRRATGISASGRDVEDRAERGDGDRHPSLPLHLERAVARLSSGRASGLLGEDFDGVIDCLAADLDAARSKSGGLRGDARTALLTRLEQADADMLKTAERLLDGPAMDAIRADADAELAAFRGRMTADDYARAHHGAVATLVRQRLQLPTLRFS
jgi:hypothetical protein